MMGEHLELSELVLEEENNETPPSSNEKKQWPYLGIVLAAVSSLFFSLCSVIVKWLVTIDPVELAVYRFAGVLLPSIPVVVWKQQQIFPSGKRVMLMLRSFVGATGLMLSFYAFRHMPLADASVIVFSVPVFVAIFAYLFLKEPCGWFNVVTIGTTVVGVLLITRPSFAFGHAFAASAENAGAASAWGAAAAFGATLFGANAYVLLRALKSLHFSVVMANFGAFALLQTAIISWYTGSLCWPSCGYERIMVLILGMCSFTGQILLTLALQLENAGPVAIARTSDIVFAFIWQVLFFKEIPNIYSLMGAFLVTCSVFTTGLRKWVISLPDNTPLKLRLHILTK